MTTANPSHAPPLGRGIRMAQLGLLVNLGLALIKLLAGIIGHTYALIADAVESTADIFASLIVWGGLAIAAQPADDNHPYGHGRAESLAGAVVALMLLMAAIGIGIEAVREIRTPHQSPAAWTLAVLVAVMAVKTLLSRRVRSVGADLGSTAVKADAWHHLSDAVTSAAAFIGISIAVWGGRGWESADDWAALVASGIIFYNGVNILRPAVAELMDRVPAGDVLTRVAAAATSVPEVRAIEKLMVRKVGVGYHVDLHVQADPALSLHDAHILSGRVKGAIRDAVPSVAGVLIHMEPYEGSKE